MWKGSRIESLSGKCIAAVTSVTLMMSSAVVSLAIPMSAYARDLGDNPSGTTIDVVADTDTVANNYGTIEKNYGTVENNVGTVSENYATVENNWGDVTNTRSQGAANGGTVVTNHADGTVSGDGTVNVNYGGTVTDIRPDSDLTASEDPNPVAPAEQSETVEINADSSTAGSDADTTQPEETPSATGTDTTVYTDIKGQIRASINADPYAGDVAIDFKEQSNLTANDIVALFENNTDVEKDCYFTYEGKTWRLCIPAAIPDQTYLDCLAQFLAEPGSQAGFMRVAEIFAPLGVTLEDLGGGKNISRKKLVGNTENRKGTKKKIGNTIYSGTSKQANNLLYKEVDEEKKKGTTIEGIVFNDDARLC